METWAGVVDADPRARGNEASPVLKHPVDDLRVEESASGSPASLPGVAEGRSHCSRRQRPLSVDELEDVGVDAFVVGGVQAMP